MGQARIVRNRQGESAGALDRAEPASKDCGSVWAVQTTTVSSYPTSAGSFFAGNPVVFNGPEVEGQPATPVADTTTVIYGLNQGSAVPPVGTIVLVHAAGGRMVFRYDG